MLLLWHTQQKMHIQCIIVNLVIFSNQLTSKNLRERERADGETWNRRRKIDKKYRQIDRQIEQTRRERKREF